MLGIRVKKEHAQKIISILKNKDLIEKKYKIKKKDEFVFIPIKEENEEIKRLKEKFAFEINDFEFEERKKNIEEELYERLPIKSFDVIGDIAIVKIPEEFEKDKEKIGEIIAKIARVKTVLQEIGKREGEFRLKKYQCIYGKDERVTIHKESGCRFLVNVEKVYFSPRLGNDRLEIAKQVKDHEKVLVMFSGIQPYPVIISKYSNADLIVSIEKNPEAHYYSKWNLISNNVGNVFLFIGDVREVLPLNRALIYKEDLKILSKHQNIFVYDKAISPVNLKKRFGIKTSLNKEEFLSKLNGIKENLNKLDYFIIEFYLKTWDEKEKVIEFSNFVKEEIKKINKDLKIDFFIHQPFELKENIKEEIIKFLDFFKKKGFYIVLHLMFFKEGKISYVFDLDEIKDLSKKYLNVYFENTYFTPSNTEKDIFKIVREGDLCFDISHYLIYLLTKLKEKEAKEKVYNIVKELSKFHNVYYHLSNFPPEGAPLDEGILDFERILPFVERGIIEVENKDELKGKEMIKSFNYLFGPLKFDRILMPLPKGSENFLDLAFKNIKSNGMIHWYQFGKEEEIENMIRLAKKEAEKQNKRIEILNIKKVGQIAPRTYRIRIDIKVI